jgi:hypothetical protein
MPMILVFLAALALGATFQGAAFIALFPLAVLFLVMLAGG